MTINQYDAHADQMAAARAEFNAAWLAVTSTPEFQSASRADQVRSQIVAWQRFLVKKGLKK